MSAAEWWELIAAVLGFLSALIALLGASPPWLAKLGSAALSASLGCIAVGLLIALP